MTQSIYRFGQSNWIVWNGDVDVIRGPIPTDTEGTHYYTGDQFPRRTNVLSAGQEGTMGSVRLGVPAPAEPITGEVNAGGQDLVENSEEFTVYVYTYVSSRNEEGPPSPPSAIIERPRIENSGDLAQVNLTVPGGPAGPYIIAFKRIYRTVTGSGVADFQFVAEIPVNQGSFEDTVQEPLEVLQTTEWDMPPDEMTGLVALPNGSAAGFVGKDLLFAEPYQLHAWPRSYMLTTDYEIVGLGVFGTNVVVCTEGSPYIATGADPSSMSLSKIEINQACVSKRSIAQLGREGVVYASPDGLVMIGPGRAEVITRELFTRREWQALNPETMVAASHDQSYIAFYDNGQAQGCIIIDAEVDGITHAGLSADAVFVDRKTDTLFVLKNGEVRKWNAGDALQARWVSKVFPTIPVNFGFGQVRAESYPSEGPVVLKVYADGVLRHTQTVLSDEPFRLPGGFLARDWQFEVTSRVAVDEVLVGNSEDLG